MKSFKETKIIGIDHGYLDYPSLIKNAGKNGHTTAQPVKKSNDKIAQEVIDGKWGNGTDRKNRLSAAGYDYQAIQNIVNQRLTKRNLKSIDEIAREVIRGAWGNGAERVKRLTAAGYDAKAVQDKVNKLI